MSDSSMAKKPECPGPASDVDLYHKMTRNSRTPSPTSIPGPNKPDSRHEPEESDPEEPAPDESEIIDPLDFERKISGLTVLDRDAALRLASDLIIRLHRRTCPARFREQRGDRTRVAYARALVSALQSYGVLLRDDEIEQLKQRIDALERIKGETKP